MTSIKNSKIKQWMDKSEDCKARMIHDFVIGQKSPETTNLYLVDDEEGIKRCFVTNMDTPVILSHYFYKWYSRRWGIETGYRVKAQDLRPRTTSKKFELRLFYFLFSTMLYNLWNLTNLCISMSLYGKVPEKPLITTKRFAIILYKIKTEIIDPG